MYFTIQKEDSTPSLHVSFEAPKGCLALLGESGSGKTALLKAIAEQKALAGTSEESFRFLSPDRLAFPEQSLSENIFRCLEADTELLLVDEPFFHLTRTQKRNVIKKIQNLLKDFPGSLIVAVREPEEAFLLGKEVLVLKQGQCVRKGQTWCTWLQEEDYIYADYAATNIHKPLSVASAMEQALFTCGNVSRGAYPAALKASQTVFECRLLLARLFHAPSPEQVVFCSNATEALNIAIKGLLSPHGQASGHVITTVLEHNSVLRPLYELEENGLSLTILPCNKDGSLTVQDFAAAIREDTRAIVCTHASNVTGNVLPASEIGALCRKKNILFLLDASQTAGIFPIDMEKSNIDVLIFTGHKGLGGPQGTGGMCLKKGILPSPMKTGGSGFLSFERRHPQNLPEALEAGTPNVTGIAGLLASVSFLLEIGVEKIQKREEELYRYFARQVQKIPLLQYYGNPNTSLHAPVLSVNLSHQDSSKIGMLLWDRFHIAVRTGAHCAPLVHEHYHTKNQGMVRFSFSYTTTKEEIGQILHALKILSDELQQDSLPSSNPFIENI